METGYISLYFKWLILHFTDSIQKLFQAFTLRLFSLIRLQAYLETFKEYYSHNPICYVLVKKSTI